MNARQKGFTVVELVVTIVISGVIIPAVAIALINLTAVNYHARNLVLANTVALNKIETLRSIGYNSISPGATTFTSELPSTFGSPKSASFNVTSPQIGIKQIDVSISYTEYQTSRTVTYRTYVSELGVGQ